MGVAVVFPGQGSQCPGFGAAWRDHPAWSLVDEAEAAAARPLAHLLLDPDPRAVAGTREAQLSVLLASLLVWRALDVRTAEPGATPTVLGAPLVGVSGHSLGQVTALLATGTVELGDGIRLAAARADASADAQRRRPGAMVACFGTDEATVLAACARTGGAAWLANVNGGGQVVIGCDRVEVDAVLDAARSAGIRRTRVLDVDGAFHTPLLAPAVTALRPVLDATGFRVPLAPLVTNRDGEAVTSPAGWPERLASHLVSPVRWDRCVARLVALGADKIIEVGPGTALSGLVRRIAPEVATTSLGSPAELPQVAR